MSVSALSRQEAGKRSVGKIADQLDVDVENGLSTQEAEQRLDRLGPNELREKETRGPLQILVEQFKTVIIWLLVAAGIAALLIGETVEGIAVFAVILVNTAIGFFTELRAVRSMQALRELGQAEASVRRNGEIRKIPAVELVPGDVVYLDSGDVVPADLRLIEANRLQADEAALTGESVPVSKQVESLEEEVELAEQKNMVFKGTAITRGSGEGIVVATGMETELGHISELVEEADEEETPLEERLDELGQRLVWLTLVVAALVAVSGIVVGRDLLLMVETAIALAVASVPEGLPITATIALARGMKRMADRNALVTQLATVETLGSTNIICTDKTGTLTAGRMSVQHYQLAEERIAVEGEVLSPEGEFKRDGDVVSPQEYEILDEALRVGVLCSNASITYEDGEAETIGEPIEVALQIAGLKAGYTRDELLQEYPEEREVAFDPDVKMMATFHGVGDSRYYVAVKGAPEALLDVCTQVQTTDGTQNLSEDDKQRWEERNQAIAKEGLRVLGLASKMTDSSDADPYDGLTFLGMVALLDPPRQEVREVIEACQHAGIRIVMATGDQELTARKIAEDIGLAAQDDGDVVHGSELQDELNEEQRRKIVKANVLTRISPEAKLTLIALHQDDGDIVAMLGDGVNDAPALKNADIGVAMGKATQVAKDAADMILQDDALTTIIVAIEQGRVIFDNIRSFMVYLLSSNVSTILTVGIASILNAPLPLLPLQILFLNVVVDVFPALALGVGEGDDGIIRRPPRDPDVSVMERRHWVSVGAYGVLIAGSVLLAFLLAFRRLNLDGDAAVTISFLTLMLAKLWHVFNMRDRDESILNNAVTRNPFVWGALGLSLVLILAAVYVPGLSDVLRTVPPSMPGWGLALGMSLVPFVAGQLLKAAGVTE